MLFHIKQKESEMFRLKRNSPESLKSESSPEIVKVLEKSSENDDATKPESPATVTSAEEDSSHLKVETSDMIPLPNVGIDLGLINQSYNVLIESSKSYAENRLGEKSSNDINIEVDVENYAESSSQTSQIAPLPPSIAGKRETITGPTNQSSSTSVIPSRPNLPNSLISSPTQSKIESSISSPIRSSVSSKVKSSASSPVKSSLVKKMKSTALSVSSASAISKFMKNHVRAPGDSNVPLPNNTSAVTSNKSSTSIPNQSSISSKIKTSISGPANSSVSVSTKSTASDQIIKPRVTKVSSPTKGNYSTKASVKSRLHVVVSGPVIKPPVISVMSSIKSILSSPSQAIVNNHSEAPLHAVESDLVIKPHVLNAIKSYASTTTGEY